jgi:Ring finger domain
MENQQVPVVAAAPELAFFMGEDLDYVLHRPLATSTPQPQGRRVALIFVPPIPFVLRGRPLLQRQNGFMERPGAFEYLAMLMGGIPLPQPNLRLTHDHILQPAAGVPEDWECSICLGEGEEQIVQHPANCAHIFHYQCLNEWSYVKPACPLCRATPTLPIPMVTRQN